MDPHHRRGWLALFCAVVVGFLAAPAGVALTAAFALDPAFVAAVVRALRALAAGLAVFGAYSLAAATATGAGMSRRRRETVSGALRLVFGLLGAVAVLGTATEQWVGALVSLGVVGIAVSLALQQPLLNLLGWVYIAAKGPYGVGDRVAIEGSKGDVLEIDFLTTTLREVNGELVTSHQPSGRLITVPNSAVLSAHVVNYSDAQFPYVWNEVAIQLAYETDLDFAADLAREAVDDYVGDEMARAVRQFRALLTETDVDREVAERPTVNVRQAESWVELRVRYVTEPTGGQRVKNELYRRILDAFGDHPDRVAFPVGRNR
jgi:small-conductance mechanosensitive channel